MKPATGVVKVFQVALVQLFIVFLLNFAIQVEAEEEEAGYCDFDSQILAVLNVAFFLKCYNFTSFPKNLEKFQTAKTLGLIRGGNNLEVLKNGALMETHLPNVESLHLILANIQNIEMGAFRGGDNVGYLNLRGNNITKLNLNVFADLPNLERLVLGDNPITTFSEDSEFPMLPRLRHLQIDSCQIRSLPPNLFTNLHTLESLDVSNNQLTTLAWTLFEPLQKLIDVNLEENPFACDCHLTEMLSYLHQKNVLWNLATDLVLQFVTVEPPSCISVDNTKVFIFSLENMTWTCPALNLPKIIKQKVATDSFIPYWAIIIGGVLAAVASIPLAILFILKLQTRITAAVE